YQHNIGLIHERRGEYDQAIARQREALATIQRVRGPDAPQTADQMCDVARALRRAGRFAESVVAHEQALSVVERAYGPRSKDMAVTLEGYSRALAGARRTRDAE